MEYFSDFRDCRTGHYEKSTAIRNKLMPIQWTGDNGGRSGRTKR